MYLAIIILPLLASIISGFFGRKVGVSGAQLITCTCVILTTCLAIVAFGEVVLNSTPVYIWLFKWLDSESLNVLWGFNFDSLTVSMLIPVLIISSLVHIYSVGYMSHDPHNQRFFSYLSLFTFMMVILVTANNFLLMFVGWEGVGVCSYLLVSFWYTRIAANQSSMSAFLTNRVGDCFLTLGMFAILWTFGNLDYSTVFSLAPYINENAITVIGICLLIGAMAKSSQIGLHVWLPLAMEGPTPVSALIHAATMVTAGVYLLMRSSPLIEYSSTVLVICLWIGSVTTVFSSLIGLFQQDIKKVIAYSTMSQLGMMVIAVGLSSYNIALFHLINHAFYKGLLFLGAGAVIHAVSDNQDFRKYGGLISFLPLTYTVMLIASLSLVAFPFMTGFYSKDFILESAFGQFRYSSIAVYFIATTGAVFTTLYSVKVLYLTFIAKPNGPLINYKNAHEGDIFMSLPLVILAVFSVFFGYICKDMFIGIGTNLFADNALFIHPTHEIMLNTEFGVAALFKLLPFVLTLLITILSIYVIEILPVSIIYFKSSRLGYNIFSFFSLRFLIEFIYNKYISRLTLGLGGQTTKVLDKGSVELIGPYGLEKGLLKLSNNLSRLDSGVVTSYALYILIALILYMLIPYVFYSNMNLLMLITYSIYMITETYNTQASKLLVTYVTKASIMEYMWYSLYRIQIYTVRSISTQDKGKGRATVSDDEEIPQNQVTRENSGVEINDHEKVDYELIAIITQIVDANGENGEDVDLSRAMLAIELDQRKQDMPQSVIDSTMRALPQETVERYNNYIKSASELPVQSDTSNWDATGDIDSQGRYVDAYGRPILYDDNNLPMIFDSKGNRIFPGDNTKDEGTTSKEDTNNKDDKSSNNSETDNNNSGEASSSKHNFTSSTSISSLDVVFDTIKSLTLILEPLILYVQETEIYIVLAQSNVFSYLLFIITHLPIIAKIFRLLIEPLYGPLSSCKLKYRYFLFRHKCKVIKRLVRKTVTFNVKKLYM